MKARIRNKVVEIPEEWVRGGVDSDTRRKDRPTVRRERVVNGNEQNVQFSAPSPYIFSLNIQIPSGKNAVQITRNGKRYPQKRFKVWREAAMLAIGKTPAFDGPVSLIVDYTPGDKIRRDVPGLLDAICHLLEKIGTVADDAQVKYVAWSTFPVEQGKPRCVVSVSPLRQKG